MSSNYKRPRRLTILPEDLKGAQRGHYQQCVVAKAGRRQWKKRVSVAGITESHITVWGPKGKGINATYVCTDPLFTRLVDDFDGGRPIKLPATFLMERLKERP